MKIPSLCALAAYACAVPTLLAQTTAIIVVDRDATLYSSATGSIANGGGNGMFVGMSATPAPRRAVLHFDVASTIPAGSRVLSARLELTVQTSASPLPLQTDVHRLTQAWSEGTSVAPGGQGNGGPAVIGDATWLHTSYQTSFWNTPGGDFVATPSYSFELTASGSNVAGPLPGLISDVQSWLDNPASNHGWLLKGDETLIQTATKISTREAINSTEHPRLIVAYVMPGEARRWGSGCQVGAGTMQLTPVGVASGGNTIALNYSAAPTSSIGATFFALALNPLGVELLPNCTAYLPLAGAIVAGPSFLTNGSGNGASSFAVPAGFPGYLIVCQGAALDGSAFGFALSNAGVMLTQ